MHIYNVQVLSELNMSSLRSGRAYQHNQPVCIQTLCKHSSMWQVTKFEAGDERNINRGIQHNNPYPLLGGIDVLADGHIRLPHEYNIKELYHTTSNDIWTNTEEREDSARVGCRYRCIDCNYRPILQILCYCQY